MKKEYQKKGFTLIEVLGVIVVLAVIALITTPIILNVIEKAKKGALEDSAYGLLESANLYYVEGTLENNVTKTEFTFHDGIQTSEHKLSYNGKIESGSLQLYTDGKTALCITEGKYSAIKNRNDHKVKIITEKCIYNSETEEYEAVKTISLGTIWNFDYTGTEQSFRIPTAGYYQLEVWGAQGGVKNADRYGYGGYAIGVVEMKLNENIYINVGGAGKELVGTGILEGGYNGGGTAKAVTDSQSTMAVSSGGGATHVATVSGLLSELNEYKSTGGDHISNEILIVAGGGGGSACWETGPVCSYSGDYLSGGGYQTNNASATNTWAGGTIMQVKGANQTSGYSFGTAAQSTPDQYSGGGGGWYGGNSTQMIGSGGSGYIGSSRLISHDQVKKHMTCFGCPSSQDTNTYTISTTNSSPEAISEYAKKGAGYVRITYLGNE